MAEFKHLIRIANTDIDGNKNILIGLTAIKGVGFSFANYICFRLNLNKTDKIGNIDDKSLSEINKLLTDSANQNIPSWMLNRRRDREDGVSKHLLSSDIDFTVENDIKHMKMIRIYKGIRHMLKLPVRGQRTKSNFRKNKGNVLGVKRRTDAKKGS